MPGSWTHLAGRFFDVILARPLAGDEQNRIENWLTPAELAAFRDQHPSDQRHGLECGLEVAAARPARDDLVRAALLHDIGKRHARLGVIGRVFASLVILLRLPRRGRVAAYADHGVLGADELERLGSEPLVHEFARHHHGSRPESIAAEEWELLQAADRARLPGPRSHTGYAGAKRDGRP